MWLGFNGHQASDIAEKVGFVKGRNHIAPLESIDEVAASIDRILESDEMTDASEMKRVAAMCDTLGSMMEANTCKEIRQNAPEIKCVNKAVRMISESYPEKIRIADIADQVGINRSYLSNLFRQEMGVSPQEFLISFRLEKAAALLKDSHDSIGNIAAAVGYTDPLAFSKAFKQKYGVSPKTFRKQS